MAHEEMSSRILVDIILYQSNKKDFPVWKVFSNRAALANLIESGQCVRFCTSAF